MHFTFTLTFHNFLKVGKNIKNSSIYLLYRHNTHPQHARGWGQGNLDHDVVECALEEAKWIEGQTKLKQGECSTIFWTITNKKNKVLKVNKCNLVNIESKWTNEALKDAMDVVENGKTSLKKVNRHWNTFYLIV